MKNHLWLAIFQRYKLWISNESKNWWWQIGDNQVSVHPQKGKYFGQVVASSSEGNVSNPIFFMQKHFFLSLLNIITPLFVCAGFREVNVFSFLVVLV